MENTLENKSKFFALYYGQKVYMNSPNCKIPSKFFMGKSIVYKDYLELKSHDEITEEHKNECYEMMGKDESILTVQARSVICSDYLRYKGYALPYMGLSVEKLIEYGWLKIKK